MKQLLFSFILLFSLLVLACQSSSGDTPTSTPPQDSATVLEDGLGTSPRTDPAVADTSIRPAITRQQNDTTIGGEWYLLPVLASDTAGGRIPSLRIDPRAKTFSGNTGCNRMRGRIVVTDSTLTFNKEIALTRMACPGYNEQAFINNLLRTNNYQLKNGMLILQNDATELSRWSRTRPERPKSKSI